jgi:hypothetical protein
MVPGSNYTIERFVFSCCLSESYLKVLVLPYVGQSLGRVIKLIGEVMSR